MTRCLLTRAKSPEIHLQIYLQASFGIIDTPILCANKKPLQPSQL